MFRRLVILCFALLPLAAVAEIEKYAELCGNSICLHWWPKLPPISGWHHDEEQSSQLSANVLVPDGESFADAKAIIYAKAIYKPREPDIDSLEKLIDNDRQAFQADRPAMAIAEEGAVRTADGQALRSLTFTPHGSGDWERVAYGEEGDYYLIFTLSARDKATYDRVLPVYEAWLRGYRSRAANPVTGTSWSGAGP